MSLYFVDSKGYLTSTSLADYYTQVEVDDVVAGAIDGLSGHAGDGNTTLLTKVALDGSSFTGTTRSIVTAISATTSIPTAGAVKDYVDSAISGVSSSFKNPLKLIIRLFCENTSGYKYTP